MCAFKAQYSVQYFIGLDGKALCLSCNNTWAMLNEYYIG